MLSTRLKRYRNHGIQGLEPQRLGRPSMKQKPQHTQNSDDDMTREDLKEALAYLRAENAVLKKLEELGLEKKRRQIKKSGNSTNSKKYPRFKILATGDKATKKCVLLPS